jgi:glycosyltransferase involved in cell wall biosynthesis
MVRQSKQYLLSVIIPSRKRAKDLNNTIDSLLNLSDKTLDNFEIIIKVDFDDTETIEYVKQWSNQFKNISFIVNSRLDGWHNLVDFIENLIDCSKGKYVWNLNDDVLMLSKDWNKILEQRLTDFKVYYPQVKWAPDLNGYIHDFREAFPIYPKKLKELWGYLCPHNNIDNWILEVHSRCSLYPWNEDTIEYIDDIYISHAQIPDETSQDKIDTVDINHNLRDHHMNSPELYHCINLLKEHRDYLRWKSINRENIINEYKNNLES